MHKASLFRHTGRYTTMFTISFNIRIRKASLVRFIFFLVEVRTTIRKASLVLHSGRGYLSRYSSNSSFINIHLHWTSQVKATSHYRYRVQRNLRKTRSSNLMRADGGILCFLLTSFQQFIFIWLSTSLDFFEVSCQARYHKDGEEMRCTSVHLTF